MSLQLCLSCENLGVLRTGCKHIHKMAAMGQNVQPQSGATGAEVNHKTSGSSKAKYFSTVELNVTETELLEGYRWCLPGYSEASSSPVKCGTARISSVL